MKKTFILLVLLIFLITSCANTAELLPPASVKASSSQAAVQTPQPESSSSQVFVQTQLPVESNRDHIYLTQEEFDRLKGSLNILTLCAALDDDYKFETSDQISVEMLRMFSSYMVTYFDLYMPDLIIKQDGSFSATFLRDYKMYGIKKGDLHSKNNSFYFPQKGVFKILSSTFGDPAVKKYNIDPSKFFLEDPGYHMYYDRPIELQNGIYIFPEPNEYAFDTSSIETDMQFPIDITDNILTAKAIVWFGDNYIGEYNVDFKLAKDETSEFGYSISYFSAEETKLYPKGNSSRSLE